VKKLLLSLLMLLTTPALAADNPWIVSHFAGLPVYTGTHTGNVTIVYPSLVQNLTCTAGYMCLEVQECNWISDPATGNTVCENPPNYADQRVAFMHVNINHQDQNGKYGASMHTDADGKGRNTHLDTFISDMTVAPYWPAFIDFNTTNLDGITFDGGLAYPLPWAPGGTTDYSGHVYAEDLTIACPVAAGAPAAPCWADAAMDIKPLSLQANRLHIAGGTATQQALSSLKLWQNGPHYLVNSTIDNAFYATHDAPQSVGSEGGIISTRDCSQVVINVYNTTFNGSPTLPRDKISCWAVGGEPTINYLTHDPTTTGEMHPMFGTAKRSLLAPREALR